MIKPDIDEIRNDFYVINKITSKTLLDYPELIQNFIPNCFYDLFEMILLKFI